jgi:acyl-CoA thioesterase FadM
MKSCHSYAVRTHEMGPDYRLRPHHICSFFQDAIARHYAELGLAAYDLQRANRTWILTGMRVEYLADMPRWRTEATLELWSREVRRARLFCDFRARAESGALVAQGTSCWLIVDEATRRPLPLARAAPQIEIEAAAIWPGFRFAKIEPQQGETYSFEQVVLGDDTDFNHHLNNLRYLVLAFEALPLAFRRSHELASLDVRFLSEAFYGDRLRSTAVRSEGCVFHLLSRGEDKVEICRMRSEWRPREGHS